MLKVKRIFLFLLCAVLSVTTWVPSVQAGSTPKGKPFVAINDQIVEVKGAISSIQDQIDSLVSRVDTVEERVGANEQAIVNLNNQNAALQALVDNSLTSIADIQAEISLLQNDNANLSDELSALPADSTAQIQSLQNQIDANNSEIASMQSSLLMVQDGAISLESSLQGQIDNNQKLIGALQDQVGLINETLATKQSLINGTCPDGSAVQQILADGSVICETAGGGGSGSIETVFSYIGQNADPGGKVNVAATCPDGYSVVSAGMTNAAGWDVFKLHTGANSNDPGANAALLIATNNNSYTTWITAVATCMRLVP